MLVVQKYGGTSVRDIERIRNVANKAVAYKKRGMDVIVVVEWAEKGRWWNSNIEVCVENTGEKERKIVIIRP